MKKKSPKLVPVKVTVPYREGGLHQDTNYSVLLHEIREMISSTRNRVAYGVNRETVQLYWNVGACIYQEVLQNDRGDYCKKIVATPSRQLLHEFGQAFHRKNLFSVAHFVNCFHHSGIIQTLSGQLSVGLREEMMRQGIISSLSRQSHEYPGKPPTQRVGSPVIQPEHYGFS